MRCAAMAFLFRVLGGDRRIVASGMQAVRPSL